MILNNEVDGKNNQTFLRGMNVNVYIVTCQTFRKRFVSLTMFISQIKKYHLCIAYMYIELFHAFLGIYLSLFVKIISSCENPLILRNL